jgi:hypothetical protein
LETKPTKTLPQPVISTDPATSITRVKRTSIPYFPNTMRFGETMESANFLCDRG